MAVKKFSQIAASGASAVAGDFFLGVQGGTTDVLFSTLQAGRISLHADTHYYVATTGSNGNNGLAVGTPWADPNFALDYIRQNVNLGGWCAYIHLAAGTYSDQVLIEDGWSGGGFVQLQGVNATPTAVDLAGGIRCDVDSVQPVFYLNDLSIHNSLALFGTIDFRFGDARFDTNPTGSRLIVFYGLNDDMAIRLNGPKVWLNDLSAGVAWDCTAGGAGVPRGFADIDGGATFFTQSLGPVTGSPAMTDAFFKINGYSRVDHNHAVTGTATGKRFILNANSTLRTFGTAEASAFPGSLPGTIGGGSVFSVVPDSDRMRISAISHGPPATKTADYTVALTEAWSINNKAGSTCTVTLPTASSSYGDIYHFLNYQAQTLVSASSNVISITGTGPSTAILPATAGKWATLVSDGVNWIITQSN